MNFNFKNHNVLVLAPHTDDGELGMGASIAKMVEQGANVYYIAFSTAEQSVPAGLPKDILKTEVKNATQVLGIPADKLIIKGYEVRKLNYHRQEILEELSALKKSIKFDFVFLPSPNDIHQDHSTISTEGIRAFKNTTILGYELIWNNLTFNTQCFIEIDSRHLEKKIEALKAYQSQGIRNYMSAEFIEALALTRGVQIGYRYAEAFEVIRLVIGD
jgi:LmbE family N-acetylglucosaminyl deacetylase